MPTSAVRSSDPVTSREPDLGLKSARPGIKEGVRTAAKLAFAAADLFLGHWPGPRLLIYHQIGAGNGRQMDLDPGLFRRQVDWLRRSGRVVDLDAALRDPDAPDAHKDFVITVDDGYADFYENGFPVLREHGLPFLLYLTTSPIETGEPLQAGDRPLDWDQVGDMVTSGLMTVGAHTHTHPDFRGLSEAEIESEITVSNELIERRTGLSPRHFAYTKGYWDPTAEAVIRRHYDTAVLGGGPPVSGSTDRYRLARVPVQQGDGYFLFKRKVSRGMRLEETSRRWVKGYRSPT